MDPEEIGGHRLLQLNNLDELRNDAYGNFSIYKENIKKWHDARIRGNKSFEPGDNVLLFNSRLKLFPSKLKSKWSGPFTVKEISPHGAIVLYDKNGGHFMVNGHRVKHYEGVFYNEGDENTPLERPPIT